MDICMAYYPSPLGILKLAFRGDRLTELLFTNLKDLPAGNLQESGEPSGILRESILQLDAYFAGTLQIFDLDTGQEGSSFQLRVWNELCLIPYGQTISYLELARRVGDVKMTRAVGTANGSNNLSIIVPCHRVIGSNGRLTGYGGGLWRKQWLLEHEMRFSPPKAGLLF